ncbi:MAG: glycosyltransferase family 2 protein [Deltaproteobacteria bacterium]|nr:glycosyltransferase family 2 protein [Deltaproteobacteria bacterium]
MIVPVGGAAPAWSRSAKSLASLHPPPGEVIVVIDGPNDDFARQATEIGARVIILEEPGGPAKARNRGAQEASGDILFFIDSDIQVPPHLIHQLGCLFSAEDKPSAVIGSYDDSPGDPAFLSQYRNLLHHFVHQTGREQASTFWSGCGAIRRQAFQDVGGFDESYSQPSIEDIELGSRLLRAGHTIQLAKELQVKHLKQWRLGDMLKTDLWRRAVPWTKLMLKDGALVNDLNVKKRDRFGVVMAFLILGTLLASGAPLPIETRLPIIGLGLAAGLALVALNRQFFQFLSQSRGLLFAAKVVPFYWVYLLICGLGFSLGYLQHLSSSGKDAAELQKKS